MSIHEARHRRAHLRVLTAAPSRSSGIQKDRNPVTGNSDVKRSWTTAPEVEIDIVGLEGSFLDYLVEHAASIQLVMVGAARTGDVQQLLGGAGALALRDSLFSLLVVGLQRPGR